MIKQRHAWLGQNDYDDEVDDNEAYDYDDDFSDDNDSSYDDLWWFTMMILIIITDVFLTDLPYNIT